MKDIKHAIQNEWRKTLANNFNGRYFTVDFDTHIPNVISEVDRLVADLANFKKPLFTVKQQGRRGCRLEATSNLGKRLVNCSDILDIQVVRTYLTRHTFSPYFELWEKFAKDISATLDLARVTFDMGPLERCIASLREEARMSSFRAQVKNQERAARKNWSSLRKYIDNLFDKYSKLLFVRVDLGYRNDPMEYGWNWTPPDDKEVKAALVRQLRYVRRNMKSLVGYVWKLEFGAKKGHHVHCLLIFHGHQSRDGYRLGKQVIDKWVELTDGTGTGWNCNAREAEWRRRGLLGIGLIEYWNQELRQGLRRVCMYLAKSDYYARFVSPAIGRTFGKATVKRKASSRGRPRLYEEADGEVEPEKQAM